MRNRAAYFGVFTALALILSYVETLIPINFGIPGAKLGLANLIIVIVLYKTDWKEALLLSVTRIVLAGQPGGRDTEPCGTGCAEETGQLQCGRSQYRGRSQP